MVDNVDVLGIGTLMTVFSAVGALFLSVKIFYVSGTATNALILYGYSCCYAITNKYRTNFVN